MMKNVMCRFIFCLVLVSNAFAYDVVDRFTLLGDRQKTLDMLSDWGHDFVLDLGPGSMSADIFDVMDDGEQATKTVGTDADKLYAAQEFVKKWTDTEHYVRIGRIGLRIPFFSFWAWGLKVVPDINLLQIDGGALVTLTKDPLPLTAERLLQFVDTSAVPVSLQNAIVSYFSSYTAGADLINDTVCTTAGINAATCEALKNKYYYPSDTTLPLLYAYAKADAKIGGIQLNFSKDSWFGHIHPYALFRGDFLAVRNADYFVRNKKALPDNWEDNWKIFYSLDLKLGHTFDRYKVFASVEEIKLTELKKGSKYTGPIHYDTNPLFRVHADGHFGFLFFDLTPFLGFHGRSGYDFADGVYAGADMGFSFLGDRMSLILKGMLDNEHITFAPRMKLLFLELQAGLKMPMRQKKDGIDVPTIYSGDVRFAF